MFNLEEDFLDNLNKLNSNDSKVRRKAAKRLGELGNSEAVNILVAKLNHEDEIFRKAIIRALKEIGDAQAIEPLREQFKIESSVKVKALIAWALGHFIYDDFDMECLIQALDEDSIYLKRMIIFALGNNRYKKAVPKLIELTAKNEDYIVRRMAIWALKETQDQRAISAFISLLNDSNVKIRKMTSSVLVRYGFTRYCANELLEILDDDNHLGKRNAIYVLGRIGYSACVPILIEYIKSNQSNILRKEALKALERLRDKRAFKSLYDLLDDSQACIRAAAFSTIRGCWNLYANQINLVFSKAIKKLDDENDLVRLNAIQYIGQYYDSSNVKFDKKLLDKKIKDMLFNDPNPEVRVEIIWKFLLDFRRDIRKINRLRLVVNDSSPLVRTFAYYCLVRMKGNVDVMPLIKELRNPLANVRRQAHWAFMHATITKKIREVLLKELAKENHPGKKELISIISDIDSPEIASVLIDLISNDKNDVVRAVAIRSLYKQNDERIEEVLIDALEDSSKEVRKAAIYLLQIRGYPQVYQNSEILERFSYFGKKKAKKTITLPQDSIGNVTKLIDLLKTNKNKILRMRTAVALVKHVNDENVVEALIVALNDSFDRVRSTAAYALTFVKNPIIIDPLLKALNDPSFKVIRTAYRALHLNKDIAIDDKKLKEIIKKKEHLGKAFAIYLLGKDIQKHKSYFKKLLDGDDEDIKTAVGYYISEINK